MELVRYNKSGFPIVVRGYGYLDKTGKKIVRTRRAK